MRVLLVAYDNGSFIHHFPQALGYLASYMRKEGFEVDIYNQDMHHYPDEHLTWYLDRNKYDVIGLGMVAGYFQYRKMLGISEAINKSKNRPFYMIGGHAPSPEPGYFMKKTGADVVVIGEGELTCAELLHRLANGKSYSDVKGIAYLENGEAKINERRELIKDVDSIPFPAWDIFPMEYYRLTRFPRARGGDFVTSVISGRGCKFKCNFCYRMDKGLRTRSSGSIIEEIEILEKDYGINFIIFHDELLMSSEKRTIELCESFIKAKLGVRWGCNGRLNYATPDVLKVMRESGCRFINYGIEAMDDTILKNMRKVLTTKQIIDGIEASLAQGVSPGFNIIFGNIGENRETLQKGVDFLLQYDDGAQFRTIRPVTPYPGSELYYLALEKGLLKSVEDFYENKHVNSDLLAVNFTDMPDDEFHQALFEANKALIQNYYRKKSEITVKEAENLYSGKNENFRGFRPV